MVWIIKRLEQSKSVFWLDSSISRLLRALLDIHRIKQRFVIILFFFILLSAHISFPFWLIIVTDRSDFTLHQPKKVFFFKKRLLLDKKMDPICKGLHWFCCFLRLMIKFWNHNNSDWTELTDIFRQINWGQSYCTFCRTWSVLGKPHVHSNSCARVRVNLCKPAVGCRTVPFPELGWRADEKRSWWPPTK